ncbi:lamin tail domain-containing protein, partial [Flavobacterium sp.]|uniref:Ig-like domain-containing protein n=1 Tax=Flavobacterium sp. TaxID=239 RepID=UPI00248A038B
MKMITFLNKLLFVVMTLVSFQAIAQNLLVNGDFESGGAGVGFQTNYFLPVAPGNSVPRNYNILNDSFTMNTVNFSHAFDYPSGTGKMMVVDGSGSPNDKVWELLNGASIGVVSGRTYEFTYYIRSISGTNNNANSAIIDVKTNGTSSIPQLMSGPSICPVGNPSPWTKVVYRWTASTNNAQIWLVDTQTFGGGTGNDFALDNLSLIDIANLCPNPIASVTQQPTCPLPTGTIVFTSPLNTAPIPIPSDLFISEVTDESTGALSYIEIYNGTGVTKNLTNYKLKIYNNGNPGPSLNCDFPLLGSLASNDVFVISVGNLANQGGVTPDMVMNLCPGFNTNDNVRLTTSTDLEIDLWGRTDGVNFTPSNQDGYTYRRLQTAPHPSLVWNPADWTALDPQDYTDIGTYRLNSYEYSINGVNFQTSPTFTSVAPGVYNNVVIRDIITGCISSPIVLTVNTPTSATPPSILPVTYCPNATAVPLTATPSAGGTLNWYGTNATGGTASATAPTPLTTGAAGSVIHYFVSQTIGGCESTRADLPVYIGNVPTAAPFLFCDNSSPFTTATSINFDFNNVGNLTVNYSYSIDGGPAVTGTYNPFIIPFSNYTVSGLSQGQVVTLTITWNGICTPSITRTCSVPCTVTPQLTISNPAAVCSPSTVDITSAVVTAGSTGGGTLSYWTNAAATIALANPNAIATSGTYYIKSSLGSCFDIKPVIVTINPNPTLTITNPAAVCAPITVDITLPAVTTGSTGGGTLSYWTNATATTALTSPNAVGASGTYYIKSTSGTCYDIKPVLVTVNPSPVLLINSPTAVCTPNTQDITLPAITAGSTGGGTLTYWINAAATATLANPTAIAISGTYYIKSTLGTCSDIEGVLVNISTTPTLVITNPPAVCSSNTVNLTANNVTAGTSGGSFTYWMNAAATIPLANPTAVGMSGTYYIKATVGICSDIKPVIVTINPSPVLTITNSVAVCSPNTVNLTLPAVTAGSTGGGILTYWTDAAATIALANPTAVTTSGTYYIKSTLGSCTDINPVLVSINPSPSLTISNPVAVCAPNAVDITLPAITAGSTGGGTLSYWTNVAATTALVNPSAVATSGTYYIKSTVGNCFDIKPVIVTINPTPVLTITNPAAVCSPNTVSLTSPAVTAGSTGGGTLTYWTNAGATIALANPNAIAASGTYYIKSTVGSCSDIQAVIVTITSPNLVITNPPAVCAPSTVDITSPSITVGSTSMGVLSYWTNAGATIALANPTAITVSGTYYVKSTLGNCTDIEPVLVSIIANFTVNTPQPLQACDSNNDGFESFDLTQTISFITGGNPNSTVTFHETQVDANIGGTFIPTPTSYENILPDLQVIYIRVTSSTSTCFQIVQLQLNVNPTPVATVPTDYLLCNTTAGSNTE